MCADAVKFARHIGYRNAGTVEFLLDPQGHYVFIEMNPRIQVEHTVTEEVTDVDLVQSQMRIASRRDARRPRPVPGHRPAARCGAAVPHHDRGPGQRLPPGHRQRSAPTARPVAPASASTAARPAPGTAIGAHFDSMLVKLYLPRPRTSRLAVARARRAVAEFRIRGVATNIPFLQAVLDDAGLLRGPRHHVVHREAPAPADRAALGRPRHPPAVLPGRTSRSTSRTASARPRSTRARSCRSRTSTPNRPPGRSRSSTELGPEGFARWLRESKAVGVTDTTFRDAHQSLLATRVRTKDLLTVAPYVARLTPELLSARVLGRRHLRRGAAVPRRGPVGAARRAARGRAEHLPADAAARPQHRRLHAVPDGGDRRRSSRRPRTPASTSSGSSTRSTTSSRCARPSRPCANRDGGRRGRALLHRRPVRPGRTSVHTGLLPEARRADRRRGRARAVL